MGAGFVAVVVIKERRVAEAFERAGVTSADKATAPEALGIATHGIGWRRLTERAIVREAGAGLYYLDIPSWQALRRVRRRRSLAIFVLVLLAVGFSIWKQSHP